MGHGAYHIGISGWRYAGWRNRFYPRGLQQRRELEYASRRFDTIEINGSFYSLQSPASYEEWYRTAPPGFVFAVKGPRFITHMLKLRGVERPLGTFFGSGVLALRDKLGPVLWQLPGNLPYDRERLTGFFELLPRTVSAAARLARECADRSKLRWGLHVPRGLSSRRPIRHALEVRHPSYERNPELVRLLRRHRIALVSADAAADWPFFDEPTADFAYARLHGGTALYSSQYGPSDLRRWSALARRWRRQTHGDVYIYFDNDAKTHAPFDALELRKRLPDA